jgi:hypothetical protein
VMLLGEVFVLSRCGRTRRQWSCHGRYGAGWLRAAISMTLISPKKWTGNDSKPLSAPIKHGHHARCCRSLAKRTRGRSCFSGIPAQGNQRLPHT